VAEEVGVTAPALAQRFGSKHGLLVAFAAHEASRVHEDFDRARQRHPDDPLPAALAALTSFGGSVRTRAELANHLAMLSVELTDDELGQHARAQSRRIRSELTALLSEAATTGRLVPGTDPAAVADLLYVTYNGALVTWAIDGRGSLRTWLAAHLQRAVAPLVPARR
jgi:AcrR family transcriptional regulator